MIENVRVTTDRQVFGDLFQVHAEVRAEFGPYEPSDGTPPTTATVLRQLATELADYAERLDPSVDPRDAEMVERIEDDRRIFQALCTERDRLAKLSSPQTRQRLDHTERLIRIYADRLAELPGTEYGCPCVVLPSGTIYPCPMHGAGLR